MKKTKKYAWVMDALKKTPLSVKARALKYFLSGKKEYIPKKETKADLDLLMKCSLCPNMCRFDCPVSEAAKTETLTPSGRSRLAYLFETDRFVDEDVFDALYTCCSCESCKNWCPFDFSLADLLHGVHEDIVDKNIVPSSVEKVRDTLVKNHRFSENPSQQLKKKVGNQADVLYFMGCSVQDDHPEIAEAMNGIFEKNNESFRVLKEEWCCGAPLYNLGFRDKFIEFARHNLKKIKETKCSTLICSCPTCAYMFKQIYPQLGVDVPVEILHSTEYIHKSIGSENTMKNEENKSFVYHDPCTLARKLEITKQPRDILQQIQGLNVSFPSCQKENTHCCGRGGSLFHTHPELSTMITKKRATELTEKGTYIITSCPTCKSAFENTNVSVSDISEIVNKSL